MVGFDDKQALEYIDSVNEDRFWGFDPGLCRLISYEGSPLGDSATYNEFMHRREVQIRWDGWEKRILDEGYRKVTGTVTDQDSADFGQATYTSFTDDNGKLLAQPRLLDGSGGILKPGDAPVYLEHTVFRSTKFSKLGLE